MGENPHHPPQHLSPCWDVVQCASPGLNEPGENVIFLRDHLNLVKAFLTHPLSDLIDALKGVSHVGVTMDEWVTHVV